MWIDIQAIHSLSITCTRAEASYKVSSPWQFIHIYGLHLPQSRIEDAIESETQHGKG